MSPAEALVRDRPPVDPDALPAAVEDLVARAGEVAGVGGRSGRVLGTLYTLDVEPHRLTAGRLAALQRLADEHVALLEPAGH